MRYLLALAPLLALTSCAPMTPYYANTTTEPQKSVQHRGAYDLAFIEFGEQGSYQDPLQLKNVRELIEKTPRPLVVTYVHGWQNNARSGDAEKFADLLRELSDSAMVRNHGFHVVGVFMGWRGQLTKVPIAKELTFFSRKAAAERLASNFDCYDAIATISEVARQSHAADAQYTILLGHSFGGLVVERSVAHAINAEIHDHLDPAKALPADLILLLNPASDSILSRQMIAALYSRHQEGKREFVVSLTSTADQATGLAFPVGTGFAATTKAFNAVRPPGENPQTESERKYYTHTPGHQPSLVNHATVALDRPPIASEQKAFEYNLSHPALVGHVFTTDDGPGKLKLWYFKPVGDVDVPYWDVAVDPAIIKDHGDIWNPRARAMMAGIFRMNIPAETRAQTPRRATLAPKPQLPSKPDFSRLAKPVTTP